VSARASLRLATFNVNNLGREDNPDEAVFAAKFDFIVAVLRALDADVVVVNEVREPERFEELADALGTYSGRLLGDPPPDRRRIQSGLLYRLPVSGQGQWHEYSVVLPSRPAELTRLRLSRPVPWVRLDLPNGQRLLVAAVHLKSWRAGSEELPPDLPSRRRQVLGRALSIATRTSEAAGLRQLLDEAMDGGLADHYAVMGDLNDRLESTTVDLVCGLETEDPSELRANENRRLFPVGWWMDEAGRFSYVRYGRRELFDHVLVSRDLSLHLARTRAESQLLEPVHVRRPDNGQYPRSDHAPVWVEFQLSG
jgi:endonuclease/exonuclease/phosphatase family metal-dependent hydrolase